mmetsp:Transcript_136009/g.352651  ORF Transcript_136009/g.352651 Transcript_136009/m.352651 type:complete len:284 (+) Transcript_136009:415-1266(+)
MESAAGRNSAAIGFNVGFGNSAASGFSGVEGCGGGGCCGGGCCGGSGSSGGAAGCGDICCCACCCNSCWVASNSASSATDIEEAARAATAAAAAAASGEGWKSAKAAPLPKVAAVAMAAAAAGSGEPSKKSGTSGKGLQKQSVASAPPPRVALDGVNSAAIGLSSLPPLLLPGDPFGGGEPGTNSVALAFHGNLSPSPTAGGKSLMRYCSKLRAMPFCGTVAFSSSSCCCCCRCCWGSSMLSFEGCRRDCFTGVAPCCRSSPCFCFCLRLFVSCCCCCCGGAC